ncbi:MAG: amidohydrolase family protein, partial [Pseudomonadota bacterium]
MSARLAFRASIVHCVGDPHKSAEHAIEYFDDGILLVNQGRVEAVGDATSLISLYALTEDAIVDYTGQLIMPGFVDIHMHYSQTDIIASYGNQLLEWLEKYTFPAEQKFIDHAHALQSAQFFVDELLRNGTTTAMLFCTIHPQSVDALFSVAEQYNLRVIAGKVMMDRNCPELLRDTAEQGYTESQQLIDRWHGVKRLHYAVTPRFAPTSSERQLELSGQLYRENPGVYLQSHVAENHKEVQWVA